MKKRITMKFHAATVLILLAALVCYGAGLDSAGLALAFAGAVFELAFWVRVIQGPSRHGRAAMTFRYPR